jgi:hypothetical protein
MLGDEAGEGIEILGPSGASQPFPSWLGLAGGIHGPVDVFFRSLANGGEDLSVGRVFRLEGFPSIRLGKFTVDEQSETILMPGYPIEGGLRALGSFPIIHRI